MIRLATYKDTKICVALLKEFLSTTAYTQSQQAGDNLENLCKIVWLCQQKGYVWLAEFEGRAVGLLMTIKQPNMWLPEVNELRELVWYVQPEYRRGPLPGRLFLTFCRKGDALLADGQISGYFTTRMSSTDNYDLDRRGFRLVESTYIKES